jgi:hypothetical protein
VRQHVLAIERHADAIVNVAGELGERRILRIGENVRPRLDRLLQFDADAHAVGIWNRFVVIPTRRPRSSENI